MSGIAWETSGGGVQTVKEGRVRGILAPQGVRISVADGKGWKQSKLFRFGAHHRRWRLEPPEGTSPLTHEELLLLQGLRAYAAYVTPPPPPPPPPIPPELAEHAQFCKWCNRPALHTDKNCPWRTGANAAAQRRRQA